LRVLQLCCKMDLSPEPIDFHAGSQLVEEHLHHDLPAERALESQEDARHPPSAELPLQEIGIPEGLLKWLLKADAHRTTVRKETENLEIKVGEGHRAALLAADR
jgi:hypothetical protein